MTLSISTSHRTLQFVAVPLLILEVVALSTSRSSAQTTSGTNAQTSAPGFKVKSTVPDLKITKIEERGSGRKAILHVTLKNVSSKGINGMAAMAEFNSTRGFRRDSVLSDQNPELLAPGDSHVWSFATYMWPKGGTLVVCAVVFSDSSSAGDPAEVTAIMDFRRGQRIQFIRLMKHTDALRAIPTVYERAPPEAFAEVERLKQIILSLPIERDDDGGPVSPDLRGGLRLGRERLALQFSGLESQIAKVSTLPSPDRVDAIRQQVSRILEYIDDLVKRLQVPVGSQ